MNVKPKHEGNEPDPANVAHEGGDTPQNPNPDVESKGQHVNEEGKPNEYSDVIVNGHFAKIASGQASLEEVEADPNVADWIKTKLRTRLEAEVAPRPEQNGVDLKAQIKEELKVEQAFDQLGKLGLSAEEMESINSDYERYKDKLGAKEAQELAFKAAGVDVSPQAMRRHSMNLPSLGSAPDSNRVVPTKQDKIDAAQLGMSPEEYAKQRVEVEKNGRL